MACVPCRSCGGTWIGTRLISCCLIPLLCPCPHRAEALSDDACDVCLSVAYIRKTKIGTEVGHVTRDSDTTFKVKRSKVNLQGRGNIVAAFRTACVPRLAVEQYHWLAQCVEQLYFDPLGVPCFIRNIINSCQNVTQYTHSTCRERALVDRTS